MGKTLLITGSSGFLGQHLVRLVHEQNILNLTKVVLFDVKPFKKQLEYTETIPQEVITGDITNANDVAVAVKGVDFVMHTCGYVSIQTFPDATGMQKVNVEGTKNIINACVQEGVQYVVYTSSDSVVIANRDYRFSSEELSYPQEQDLLMKPYAMTKQRAEKLVVRAHGATLQKGGTVTLKTAALRPVGIYGEGEQAFVTAILNRAVLGKNSVIKLSYWRKNGDNDHQVAYAGNVAWAHLCALKALVENPEACGGQAYFVTDDTPVGTYNFICKPFIRTAGMKYTNFSIPSRVFLICLYLFELLLTIISPFVKFNIASTTNTTKMVNINVTLSRKKLETVCGYRPLYSYKESLERSIPYYKSIVKQ